MLTLVALSYRERTVHHLIRGSRLDIGLFNLCTFYLPFRTLHNYVHNAFFHEFRVTDPVTLISGEMSLFFGARYIAIRL